MGFFSRRPRTPTWQPPVPPHCSCVRHLDESLLGAVVPLATDVAVHDPDPVTVADLLHPGGVSVQVAGADEHLLTESGATFHWSLGVYDDARMHYDDDTGLDLDVALARHPGVDEVAWPDREILLLSAPTLCRDGVLAAAAMVLLDDRVRLPAD